MASTQRLVSPERVLYLIGWESEDDLKALQAKLHLSSKTLGNLRQLLGWSTVGNGQGDRNHDRDERKKTEFGELAVARRGAVAKTRSWRRDRAGCGQYQAHLQERGRASSCDEFQRR